MKRLTVDFTNAYDKNSVHECIKVGLQLPEYYDKTLDALRNCLAEMDDCEITLENVDILYTLDVIGVKILKVFEEAADTNNSILILIK